MAYEVVREVTQPVHAADGSVTHRPGDRFRLDEPLPEGVPFRLTVAEVPDAAGTSAPVPVKKTAASRPAAKGA